MCRARRPLPAWQKLSRSQKVFTCGYQRRQARNAFTAPQKSHRQRSMLRLLSADSVSQGTTIMRDRTRILCVVVALGATIPCLAKTAEPFEARPAEAVFEELPMLYTSEILHSCGSLGASPTAVARRIAKAGHHRTRPARSRSPQMNATRQKRP